ncbi:hypothetical protein ACTWPT_10060 [Nonomuraea sp. 3N208]|uniref:hypothetical protein n=1 Tax=Nonomuraea sp. 3N208 TaxID=3457421 RepID=UPI003FCD696F
MTIENPSYRLLLIPAEEPIRGHVTKLGGAPVWVSEPQWPLSRRLERPMTFIGQFRLPGPEPRMAYLFMTGEDIDCTYESEAGENALIVQPGRVPPFVEVGADASGPAICEHVVEFDVTNLGELDDVYDSRIGGFPTWLQSEEYPRGGWDFLFQLDSAGPLGNHVNFGDVGVGYGFLSPDEQEGRFLWQCC